MNSILLISLLVSQFIKAPNSAEVRALYLKSPGSETACNALINLVSSYNPNTHPLFAGYKASATMILANHTFNPFKKLEHFNTGKSLLEKSVAADMFNVELRFLRFSVQSEAPSFLGYNNSLEKDKTFILNTYSGIADSQLKSMILAFMKNSAQLSTAEKLKLK